MGRSNRARQNVIPSPWRGISRFWNLKGFHKGDGSIYPPDVAEPVIFLKALDI